MSLSVWMPTISTGTGAEVYARRLADGLTGLGHRVKLEFAPHRFQYAPWFTGLRPPPDCDVTIANSWNAAAFAYAAPLVTVVHHVVHDPSLAAFKSYPQHLFHRGFVLPMERATLARSAAVVAVSRTTAKAVEAHLGLATAVTIINGVDTDYFTPEADSAAPRGTGPLKLLFVGKPSHRKGFDIVGRLVNALGDACSLTCIGPEAERGLSLPPGDYRGRVSREELRQAYRQADFLLLPSRLEGFGYAAAEALACGTPVICGAAGAVPEISCPPRAAIAIDESDMQRSARDIADCVKDHARHARMRQEARQIACSGLDEMRWLAEMETLIRSVAART